MANLNVTHRDSRSTLTIRMTNTLTPPRFNISDSLCGSIRGIWQLENCIGVHAGGFSRHHSTKLVGETVALCASKAHCLPFITATWSGSRSSMLSVNHPPARSYLSARRILAAHCTLLTSRMNFLEIKYLAIHPQRSPQSGQPASVGVLPHSIRLYPPGAGITALRHQHDQ